MSATMLEARDVWYSYAGESQTAAPTLADISLAFSPGQMVALLGHNGSGKSTLAKLLAGVLTPMRGTVTADGFDTRSAAQRWEARRLVGLVFQNPDDQLIANTLIDEVSFGPENLGLSRQEIERRVHETIKLLDLEHFLDTPLNELSLGQKQRAAIAGVLAMEPRYLIMDEPTTMLPPQMAEQLLATITFLARERQMGVIYITHRMDEVTGFDRVVVAHQGHIAFDGTPRAVFSANSELRAIGLDSPAAMTLAQRLHSRGFDVRPDALTVEEVIDQIAPYARPEIAAQRGVDIPPTPSTTAPTVDMDDPRADIAEMPVLETRDLRHTHLAGTPFAQVALDGVDIAIRKGSFVAIVGPSRSGKSTLLDCLNAVIKPGNAMVYFNGTDVTATGFDLDRLRAAVGAVYQSPESQILEDIVGKDVAFGLVRKRVPLAESRRRVQESLEAVGLPYEDFRNRYTYALSGGEKRRVAIAGVLAMEPEVLVLDEPTAGLDPRGREEFLQLIQALRAMRRLTVVYLTAGLEDVADLAEYIYVLKQGKIARQGTPSQILRDLPDLVETQIGLSTVSRLALSLRAALPGFDTTIRDIENLESHLVGMLRPPEGESTLISAPVEAPHD